MDNEVAITEPTDISFADFESAMADEPAADQPQTVTEEGGDPAEQPDTTPEEPQGDAAGEGSGKPDADSFTLKVNKQTMTVSRDEVIALAQKGADYDRVKEAAQREKNDNASLREQLAKTQGVYTVMEELAAAAGTDIQGLLNAFRLNQLKGEGLSEDVAQERLARLNAERELQTFRDKAKQQTDAATDAKDRAKREVAEFRRAYPDVELTEALLQELMPDVQSGNFSLMTAYQKRENRLKDEQIAQLQADLAAQAQNKANRSAATGSMRDQGAARTKDAFDEFFEAFD